MSKHSRGLRPLDQSPPTPQRAILGLVQEKPQDVQFGRDDLVAKVALIQPIRRFPQGQPKVLREGVRAFEHLFTCQLLDVRGHGADIASLRVRRNT